MMTTSMHRTGVPARSARWWTLAAVALATFVTSLDNTVVNVALPSIQRDLGLGIAGLEWVASAYMLVFAGLLLAGGRLADRYGRRRLFLIGLAVFTAASAVAGVAGSESMLIAARAAQGIGAALLTPTTLAILTTTFPRERERHAAVGVWSGIAGLALVLGPLAGGALTEHWRWHAIFWVNIPIGLVTLVVGRLAIAESRQVAVGRLDLPGLATSAVALVALAYALIDGHRAGWTSAPIVGALVVAVVAAAAFVVIESRVAAPMVELSLFANRVFTGGTLAVVLWGLGVIGVYFYTSLYLQGVLRLSPTTAGAAFVPLALLMAAAAPLATPLVGRIGAHRTVAAGFVLVAAGLLAVSRLGQTAGVAELMPGFVLIGIGSGLTTPLTASILGAVPAGRAGVASGLLTAARETAALLGVTVVGAILTTRQTVALAHGAAATHAFLAGYTTALTTAAGLMFAAALLTAHILNRRSPTTPQPTEPVSAQARVTGTAVPEPVG